MRKENRSERKGEKRMSKRKVWNAEIVYEKKEEDSDQKKKKVLRQKISYAFHSIGYWEKNEK